MAAPRTHVEVTVTEQILILQAYSRNRCNWPVILDEVRKNAGMLPNPAQTLYKDGTYQKLKRRMSDQVKRLTKEGANNTVNEQLKGLTRDINNHEGRYSQKRHPAVRRQLAKKVDPAKAVLDQAPQQQGETHNLQTEAPLPQAAPLQQANVVPTEQVADAPLQAVEAPIQVIGAPLQAVGAPVQAVGAPVQAVVGAPLQAVVGAPVQAVGAQVQPAVAPIQAVGAPVQAVGIQLQAANAPQQPAAGDPIQPVDAPLQGDHRRNAINVPDESVEEEGEDIVPLPRRKSTTELAREAYLNYSGGIERTKKLEDKLDRCMDKFLSM